MKKNEKKPLAYTFADYKQKFYPQDIKQQTQKLDNQNAIGTEFAKESLCKVKSQLTKK